MKWTITRQELLLFHPRHKRVRLFYEHDKAAESQNTSDDAEFSRYRKHAQDIFKSLQAVLEGFPNGAEISFEDKANSTLKCNSSIHAACRLSTPKNTAWGVL